jgi:hypothetical protein
MPIYGYRCRTCGATREAPSNTDIRPCPCGGISRRDYHTVQLRDRPGFVPHYNWSVGAHVNSQRGFDDELKRCEERNSIAAGCEHKYESVDLSQVQPAGDTQVLEDRARNLTALGLRETTSKHSTVSFDV